MIDAFVIFTKGGLVLWKYELSPLEGDPIALLLQNVLITERQGLTSYSDSHYQLKWAFANEFDLVFVAIVLKIGKNTGIDDILSNTKHHFVELYKTDLKARDYKLQYDKFENIFTRIVDGVEQLNNPSAKKTSQSKSSQNHKNNLQQQPSDSLPLSSVSTTAATTVATTTATTTPSLPYTTEPAEGSTGEPTGDEVDEVDDVELQRLIRIQARMDQRKQNQAQAKLQKETPKSPKGKAQTKWDDSKYTKDDMNALDMSEGNQGQGQTDNSLQNNYGISQRDVESTINSHGAAPVKGEDYWDVDKDQEKIALNIKKAEDDAKQGKGVWGYFQGLVGQKELTKEDLEGVSQQFTERLVNKNVSPEIAKQLVESVISGLVGKKLGTFNTMYSTIKASLEESLTRLLTPKKPVDIMTGVAQSREQQRPYSIVFCGVNGVGKSTSLSKIASFFLSQGLTVGVAACDTFRSGAIEQLKTHCAALKIPLYDKGYGRDEASVAQDGIMNAKKDGLDVILIDTAGRMQGNDPLMKGLARLMNVNNPDLILFVGEALVGNDGCDQLINFNRALRENSGKSHPRLIDGIVLTKFDTIDDKVGTAINMTYSTGQPILFVGVGQRYRDLKRPNPRLFIDALFG